MVRFTTVRSTTQRFTTVRFTTVRFTTVRFTTVRFTTERFTTERLTTVRFTTVRFTTVEFTTVRFTTVRFTTERLTLGGGDRGPGRPGGAVSDTSSVSPVRGLQLQVAAGPPFRAGCRTRPIGIQLASPRQRRRPTRGAVATEVICPACLPGLIDVIVGDSNMVAPGVESGTPRRSSPPGRWGVDQRAWSSRSPRQQAAGDHHGVRPAADDHELR